MYFCQQTFKVLPHPGCKDYWSEAILNTAPRGEAGTSGFLSVSDCDRRVPVELGQESHHEEIRDEPRGWGNMPNDADSPVRS